MNTLLLVAERGSDRFEITEENGLGFYVLRYEGNKSTHDYLQDDLAMAKR